MDAQDNVTIRRAHTTLVNRDESSNMSIDNLNVSTSSLPDLSSTQNIELESLMQKIEILQTQLNSANQEIEQLSLENRDLRSSNHELAKKNALYKKIGFSPTRSNSHATTLNSKKHNTQSKSTRNKDIQTDDTNTHHHLNGTTSTAGTKTTMHKETQTIILPIPAQYTSSIQTQTENIDMAHKGTQTYILPQTTKTLPKKSSNTPTKNQNPQTHKPNIYILSSNKENKVLSVAEDVMCNYELCHYLTPQAHTSQLLIGLQEKLMNFTMNDFCIIFISNQDFVHTMDYAELVADIRKTVHQITHTNIILCTPTYYYGFGTDTINRRIYNFNELLLQDILLHKHALIFDTNKHLTYDYSMFHKPTRKVNNNGLRTIFQHLRLYMKEQITVFRPTNNCINIDLTINDSRTNNLFRV